MDRTVSKFSLCPGDARMVKVDGIAKPINAGSADRARLIAAAPELFEAVRHLLEFGTEDAPTVAKALAALAKVSAK